MEDVEIVVKGFWFADEAGALCEQLFGVRCECSTADGLVVVHPRPRALSEEELAQLRVALSLARPSAEERAREIEMQLAAREAAHKSVIERLRQKAKERRITVADLNDLVLAVLGEG